MHPDAHVPLTITVLLVLPVAVTLAYMMRIQVLVPIGIVWLSHVITLFAIWLLVSGVPF